jgi:hypothetical protein
VSLLFDLSGHVYLWDVRDIETTESSPSDPLLDLLTDKAVGLAEHLQEDVIGEMPIELYGEPGRLVGDAKGVVEATASVNDLLTSSTFVFHVEQDGCLVTQCSAGNLLTDLMLNYCSHCTVAHINGGAIVGSIPAGNVTRGALNTMLPNATLLVSYELLGSDLLDTVRQSISNVGLPTFQQWSGIRFAFHVDANGAVGITSATVQDEENAWVPLQPNGLYSLITTDFVYHGMGTGQLPVAVAGSTEVYDLQLFQWVSLQVQSGAFLATALLTRDAQGYCWNTSFALQSDSVGGFLWPRTECRWLTSIRQVCPPLEVPTSTNLSRSDLDPQCQCIASYTRKQTTVGGVQGCEHCNSSQAKTQLGDHPCVCDSTHYLLPTWFNGQPFQCVDPTGQSTYPLPAPTDDPCKQCPASCLGCLLWNETKPIVNALTPEEFDAQQASWWILPKSVVWHGVWQRKYAPFGC